MPIHSVIKCTLMGREGIFVLKCYPVCLQFVMPTLGWRWLLALSSLPSSLLLLFYSAAPESPRFLCLKGRTTEALSVLEKIARLNGKKLPSGNLISDHQIELQEKSPPSEDSHLLSPRSDGDDTTKGMDSNDGGGVSSVLMLFSPELVKSTLLLWLVFFGNAFSYYGLVLLTSELSTGDSKCVPNQKHSEKSHDVSYKNVFITSFAGNLSPHYYLILLYLSFFFFYIYISIYIYIFFFWLEKRMLEYLRLRFTFDFM